MSAFSHTFNYEDKADFIHQMEELTAKLLAGAPMEDYQLVRARYPKLSPSAFTMRLRRFESAGGFYPNRRGRKGEKIQELFVTSALDRFLRLPRYRHNRKFRRRKVSK